MPLNRTTLRHDPQNLNQLFMSFNLCNPKIALLWRTQFYEWRAFMRGFKVIIASILLFRRSRCLRLTELMLDERNASSLCKVRHEAFSGFRIFGLWDAALSARLMWVAHPKLLCNSERYISVVLKALCYKPEGRGSIPDEVTFKFT
jgi:hypothetical protein